MHTRLPKGPLAIGLALTVVACGSGHDGAGAADGTVERDSAGVRIVEIAGPATPLWSVAAAPIFSIGWAPDDPPFSWIQSGRIRPDGGAFVGEYEEGSVFVLGPDGTVEDRWGRRGEGPGEYEDLGAIVLLGDSLLVSDGRLRRLTRLTPAGDVVATRPKPGSFLHEASSVLGNGRIVLIPGDGYSAVRETRPEWVFEEQPILAADLRTGSIDTLATLPHLLRWFGERGGPPAPLAVWGRAGGFDDGFAWARSDRPEVLWFDSDGRLARRVRWHAEPTPVDGALRAQLGAYWEERLRAAGVEEEFLTRQLTDMRERLDRFEGSVPFWRDHLVDRRGDMWLADYPLFADFSGSWHVVTRDGARIGPIELPGVVDILDATDDRILVVRLDEREVPAVQMLALRKGG